ncbi:MAG: DUF5011 domain-containing protein [Bacilli bacterium]|nr:DUF5011 domain-containing protein [Bacilli bacterium]
MNIRDLYTYNKKTFWIVLSLVAVILVVAIIFLNNNSKTDKIKKSDKYDMALFGETKITLKQGSVYDDPGYYAINNNEIVTSDVKVVNNVDTNIPGTYEITYIYKDIIKNRTVIIEKNNDNIEDRSEDIQSQELKITLNGDNLISIMVGDNYEELGAEAYYGDIDVSNEIIKTGQVDTNTPGTYEISYSIEYNKQSNYVKRVVKVIDKLKINVSYDDKYTNQNIMANVNITGSDFLYLKLPNDKIIANNTYQYEISENGTYKFYVYDKNNNYEVETINVTNIDKTNPSGTCKAEYSNGKTTVNVTASDNLGIAYYIYSNDNKSTANIYSIDNKLANVSVSIYDLAGNSKTITCNVTDLDAARTASKYDYIEMHFMVTGHDDDAILIRTKDKVIMIDGGRYEDKDYVIPYLKKLGIKKIDAMIGSHVHYNHVQAQAAILDNFTVSHAYYSVDIFNCASKKINGYYQCKSDDNRYIASKLKSKKTPTTILKAGSYLEIGEMKLYFVGPIRGLLTTYQNANSLVFILEYKGKKFMFTGDTPDKYMTASKFKTHATKLGTNLNIDVLKWPHHGYETLTDEFFKATTPQYAIIPNCCHCSSRYPSSTNKNLMKKYNTKYYQVCDSKNIVLTSDGSKITIKTNQSANSYKR